MYIDVHEMWSRQGSPYVPVSRHVTAPSAGRVRPPIGDDVEPLGTDSAVEYAADLMRKNYPAVGFLPTPRLDYYAQHDQLWIQYENDDPCGYLVFGAGWPILRVYQCCIQTDARRSQHAGILINALLEVAKAKNCSAVSLWCASDLEANVFWEAMGFRNNGTREGGQRRGRIHINWVYWLSDLFAPLA